MHPAAPFKYLQHHRPAVSAVMRCGKGIPDVDEKRLKAAKDEGFVKFTPYPIAQKGGPKGLWELTARGSDLMTDY